MNSYNVENLSRTGWVECGACGYNGNKIRINQSEIIPVCTDRARLLYHPEKKLWRIYYTLDPVAYRFCDMIEFNCEEAALAMWRLTDF